MQQQVKIKLCGLTQFDQVHLACQLSVDAIGFVFVPQSPRYIDPAQVKSILEQLKINSIESDQAQFKKIPQFIGLFVNQDKDYIWQVLNQIPLDILQFHGNESDLSCRQFQKNYWKSVGVQSQQDIIQAEANFPGAQALVLDRFDAKSFGGTGQAFSWQHVPALDQRQKNYVIAGGLTPENVSGMIKEIRPAWVDVSSGIEQSKGVKCPDKMRAFVRAVQNHVFL